MEVIKSTKGNQTGLHLLQGKENVQLVITADRGNTGVFLDKAEAADLAKQLLEFVSPCEKGEGSPRTVQAVCRHCHATIEVRVFLYVPFKMVLATEKCPSCGKRISAIAPGEGKSGHAVV